MEEWRDIEGYEGLYQISSLGRVKSLVGRSNHSSDKMLKLVFERYVKVKLYKNSKGKTFPVHRLVAKAFIANGENKKEVNHIDCNKYNNNVSNLEWCTRAENHLHKCKNGLNNVENAIEKNKIKIVQMTLENNPIKVFSSMSEAGRALNISVSNICNVCKGKLKQTGGYKFKYLEEKHGFKI